MSLPVTGTVPTTKGTLYTVPANRTAWITSIEVVNASAATRTVTLYANIGGTSSPISQVSASIPAYGKGLEEGRILRAGESIEGVASDANVTYVINGEEK